MTTTENFAGRAKNFLSNVQAFAKEKYLQFKEWQVNRKQPSQPIYSEDDANY
jgi:hypothetical protein